MFVVQALTRAGLPAWAKRYYFGRQEVLCMGPMAPGVGDGGCLFHSTRVRSRFLRGRHQTKVTKETAINRSQAAGIDGGYILRRLSVRFCRSIFHSTRVRSRRWWDRLQTGAISTAARLIKTAAGDILPIALQARSG